ncbi:MAG: metalloregulator ArsR/SmtB family transcription factor [Deltaproteobacteria bacterium]|nr:metalloregulator ArsR/SmtB family transcription factor [Deltaproteobacteria bacterium]
MDLSVNLVTSLKALADDKRLKILRMLLTGDLCVGALAKHLGISKPAVSQHLRILRKTGLVKGEKRGYWTHYIVDRQALTRIAAELNEMSARIQPFQTICLRTSETPAKEPKAEEADLCQNCCREPHNFEDQPKNRSPEQIGGCHDETKSEPCTQMDSAPEQE